MIITYKLISDINDPLISLNGSNKYESLPYHLRQYFEKWDYPEADNAYTATKDNKLVGTFRFTVNSKGHLWASGTWVTPALRRSNIALSLWSKTLQKFKPSEVYVYTTSTGGFKLVERIIKKFPQVSFDHCYD